MPYTNEFIRFAEGSPTAFQAADNARAELEQAGFVRLYEDREWELADGGKYYVSRNGSALIAFTANKGARAFRLTASHSDSPTFKLKPVFEEASCGYVRINTERYGGTILSAWFDRPLSAAGRLAVRTENGIEIRHVNIDRDLFVIPSMPIHFNREVNDGYKYNPQVDTLPLMGSEDAKGELLKLAARCAGAEEKDVLSHELYLYARTKGFVWGHEGEYFSCPRIDDLMCAYTSLKAFLASRGGSDAAVYALLDNEEVGSATGQGADSTFLHDVLYRAARAMGRSDALARGMIAHSFMVSADNAHAVHPNHPEKYDADNRVRMNGGVVVKTNANRRYTTDAVSQAVFCDVLDRAGVPVQYFANRSDVPGGSTLGNIANTHASMNTVDIGLAQLAMHSPYETAGSRDTGYMVDALKAYYESEIRLVSV